MSELSERRCVVCRSDTPTLSEELILNYLELVEGWSRREIFLERVFAFKNFADALRFFNYVARIAEHEDHHPDMGIYAWRNVKLSFTTHAVHGLTENDFVMAAKVNQVHSAFG